MAKQFRRHDLKRIWIMAIVTIIMVSSSLTTSILQHHSPISSSSGRCSFVLTNYGSQKHECKARLQRGMAVVADIHTQNKNGRNKSDEESSSRRSTSGFVGSPAYLQDLSQETKPQTPVHIADIGSSMLLESDSPPLSIIKTTNHSISSIPLSHSESINTRKNYTNSDLLRPISSIRTKRRKPTATTKTSLRTDTNQSSTMQGFKLSERLIMGKRKAHEDGLKIAERASGNSNIRKMVNRESEVRKRTQSKSVSMYQNSASVPQSLIQFTAEIHQQDRISPSEELELGTMTQEAIRLQSLYDNLSEKFDREPTDDEWCAAAGKINMEAIREAIEAGIESKNRLVTSNLRMVQGVVNLYIRNGLGSQYNAGDLMQEGTLALIRAAEKFEPKRGFRFSTYAMYWIRAAVKRSQIKQSRIINVPQRIHETHKKVMKINEELKTNNNNLGRNPTKKELATSSGLTEIQLNKCFKAMGQQCYSLDAAITNSHKPNSSSGNGSRKKNNNEKETIKALIVNTIDDDDEIQRMMFIKDDLINTLRRYLLPHQVDLLLLRYGLMEEEDDERIIMPSGFSGPLTIAQISQLVGLKPDKVRRMINTCLQQLKPMIANEWHDFEKYL